MRLPARIEEIARDNKAGAVELALRAADILRDFAAGEDYSPERLEEIARALVEAQPSMAPLLNLANGALWNGSTPESLAAFCDRFTNRLRESTHSIAKFAPELIAENSIVLTHSYSSTVLASVRKAKSLGRQFEVICTESRPIREGVELANRLSDSGIAVTLVVDAAMHQAMTGASIVLVGADAVSTRGIVNKTGTMLAALAAREQGKPVYALCGGEKFVPATYTPPPERPKPAAEIYDAAANVSVRNFYFEETPLELFTRVITEEGPLTAAEIVSRLNALPLHPALI